MKKLIFLGTFFIVAGAGVIGYGIWAQQKQNEEDFDRFQEIKQTTRLNSFIDKFNKAKSKQDYKNLETGLANLSKKHQELLGPQIKLKLAVFDFEAAEDLLDRARALQQSLTDPMLTQKSDAKETASLKVHPSALSLFEKSIPLYQNAKKEVDRLNEAKDDPDYNFRLNYIKGEVYHRYTQLFGNEETARELFNQTVVYYKQALRFKPADTNTVINIELLIRDEDGMAGPRTNPSQTRSKLLNQAPGSGRYKGH